MRSAFVFSLLFLFSWLLLLVFFVLFVLHFFVWVCCKLGNCVVLCVCVCVCVQVLAKTHVFAFGALLFCRELLFFKQVSGWIGGGKPPTATPSLPPPPLGTPDPCLRPLKRLGRGRLVRLVRVAVDGKRVNNVDQVLFASRGVVAQNGHTHGDTLCGGGCHVLWCTCIVLKMSIPASRGRISCPR